MANGRDENVQVAVVDREPIRVPTPPPVDNSDLYADPRRPQPPVQPPTSTVPVAVMVRPETPAPAPVAGAPEQPQDVVDERMEDIMSASSDSSAADESLRTTAEGSHLHWGNVF